MNLGGHWDKSAITKADIELANLAIDTALECGIKVFDLADIYKFGKSESTFGKILAQRPELREKISLQSKCGICFEDELAPQRYDFSANWLMYSVDNILSRLGTECLDVLMLHRPDPLMDVNEIADTFAQLQKSGKVRKFGVSNMQQHQMAYLQSALDAPLVCNQLEISLSQLAWLDNGIEHNTQLATTNFDAGTLEYCQLNNVQIQAWGSMSNGLFSGRKLSNEAPHIHQTVQLVTTLANQYNTAPEAIILAFIMRHPANIQPVIGTTDIKRIKACQKACDLNLSREDWYSLYVSARGQTLP
jgi:predicted oxidoreductase